MYETIRENSIADITEKRSKFIAKVFYIETKEKAEEFIKEQKKEFHDARHHCYAYRVLEKDSVVEKSSDDGEPSGTAGAPLLTLLQKYNMVNVIVVVIRYFGGILLGTGGLVKAYTEAAQKAIKNAHKSIIEEGEIYQVDIPYKEVEKFKYFSQKNAIKVIKEEYLENANFKVFVPKNKIDCLKKYNNSDLHTIEWKKIEKTYTKNP